MENTVFAESKINDRDNYCSVGTSDVLVTSAREFGREQGVTTHARLTRSFVLELTNLFTTTLSRVSAVN